MYRIMDKRGSGKTSRLMLLAKENNSIIVCSNPYAMREKAHNYGIVGIDFISYNDFIQGDFNPDRTILIDEMENCIKIFAPNLMGYTMSMED